MSVLKLYFRTYLRQGVDSADYFRTIKGNHPELTCHQVTTTYMAVGNEEAADLKKKGFILSDSLTSPSVVIHEMVGTISMESMPDQDSVAEKYPDSVFAEYVTRMVFDRGPQC